MTVKRSVLDGELAELLGANKTGAALLRLHNEVVWERYWDGFGPDSRFDLYSAGKAFTMSAVALLLGDGLLRLDEPACRVLTEWGKDERRDITVRHLLTMTSGLRLDFKAFSADPDPTAATLAWPLERAPGTVWCYEQATAHALGIIVTRLTGHQLIVLLRERILGPIGALDVGWLRSQKGDCTAWRSVFACARDLARFGQLFLGRGKWQGQPLLPESIAMQATTHDASLERTTTDPRQKDFRRRGYGWLLDTNSDGMWEGVDRRCFAFLGAFHNICLVDPSRDFVFVRLVTPEAQGDRACYENALDVTDTGTARVWRAVLAALE